MFARIVSMNLKPGERPSYARTTEEEVIPLLRKFTGFRDEIALVSTDEKQAIGISLWERREDAEDYNRSGFPDVVRALAKCTEGTPSVEEYEVTNSTVHEISVRKAGG